MLAIGYRQSKKGHTLFIKHSKSRRIITLLIYVDDIIDTTNDEGENEVFRQHLVREFKIRKLEKLNISLDRIDLFKM